MNSTSAGLLKRFQRAFTVWRGDSFSYRPFGAIYLGCESRSVPAEYRWDGMRRGADPRHPRIVFQATLRGRGAFESGGRTWPLGPETAFLAVVPSRHVYCLPADSTEWSFFWFTFVHPYVVRRLTALAERYAPVFPLASDAALMIQSLSFFERSCHGRFEDRFAEEGALFEWMLALERHVYELAHPRSRREAMLDEVKEFTLANLGRSFGIEELARRRAVSRSHFSHQFREATGLAPAAYVLEVRLAEVRRRLHETSAPLKEIASTTGFADANHLCKAFRRGHHISPGAYRVRGR